jgi:hypothetical protein
MCLTMREVVEMDEVQLREILNNRIPEGAYLDYKMQLPGVSANEGKREFLKDVTAVANG